MVIYLQLTREFNRGRLRAILAGGQAVVLHRLAIMSKDADWILREDDETMRHVLSVLETYGAHYRFGAPLDVRWLSGGWSAHLEFPWEGLRVRTDFVTRPPRLDAERLARLWRGDHEGDDTPFLNARDLADTKKTDREKDYAVIGELARRMSDPDDRLLYSRSARDLMELAARWPERAARLAPRRPLLARIAEGRDALEAALDAERRQLMRANERRLACYAAATQAWAREWPALSAAMADRPLSEAHALMVRRAEETLPMSVAGGWP